LFRVGLGTTRWALGQRVVGHFLHDIVGVAACRTFVGVDRHLGSEKVFTSGVLKKKHFSRPLSLHVAPQRQTSVNFEAKHQERRTFPRVFA
jgi:hypothetical protein